MCHMRVKGSFTVEICLLFPTILFVIIALISLVLFLHDRVIVQSILSEEIEKECMWIKYPYESNLEYIDYENINKRGVITPYFNSYTMEEYFLKQRLQTRFNEKVMYLTIKDIKVDSSYLKVEVLVELELPIKSIGVKKYFGLLNRNYKFDAVVYRPADFIKSVNCFYTTTSKINGFDEIKEKLQKVVSIIK